MSGALRALDTQATPGTSVPTAGAVLRRMQRLPPRSSQLAHAAKPAHAAQQPGAASTLTSLRSPSCGWGKHSGVKAVLQFTDGGRGASSACAVYSSLVDATRTAGNSADVISAVRAA